jgi:hypothetical protein
MNVVIMNSSQDSLCCNSQRVASDGRIQGLVMTHQPIANPRNGQQIKDLRHCEHSSLEFCVTSGNVMVLKNLWPMPLLTARFFVVHLTMLSVTQVACFECLDLSMALHFFLLDCDRFFSFLILYRFGRTPLTVDQPVAKTLRIHRTTQTQNKSTHTDIDALSMIRTYDPSFRKSEDHCGRLG